MGVVAWGAEAASVVRVVGVAALGDEVAAFGGVVVGDGGVGGPALDAYGVAGEYGLSEGLVAFGVVGVAVGAACPVGVALAGGAAS